MTTDPDPHQAASVESPEPGAPDETVSIVEALTWLGEGKKLIAVVTLTGILTSVVYSLLQPNIYTAQITLLPSTSQQQSGSAAALAALGALGPMAGSLGAKSPDELYVSLLKSDSVRKALAARFKLHEHYGTRTYEELRQRIPEHVRATSDKKSSLITVEVDDKDPQFAADLANAHATEVTKLLGRLAVSEAQQRRVFFEQQLSETKENLIRAEQALRGVQEKSGMVVLDQQAGSLIEAAAQLKARIAEREVHLKVMRTVNTAENPDVKKLMSELSALRAELARMESTAPPVEEGQAAVDIPIGQLPATAIDYVRALREVKFQETMLASMLRQFEAAKLDEAKDASALQQVDVAVAPDRKSKPARALMVLMATVSSLLGACAFVALRRFRRKIQEESAEQAAAWASLARAWRWRR